MLDGITLPDDAYLSLTIARNIAAGEGPLYGDAHTNGFQPLYVFLMAPVYLAIQNDLVTPVHLGLILLSIFDSLTLYLLIRWIGALATGFLPPLIAAVAWIANPYALATTLNGLETAISCFFMVASLYCLQRSLQAEQVQPRWRRSFSLGLLIGLAILARNDNAILGLSIGVVLIGESWWSEKPLSVLLGQVLLMGLGAALAYLPWALYSYAYTGEIYPVSGRAVRFMSLANVGHEPTLENFYLLMLGKGLHVVMVRNRVYLIGIAALVALCIRLRPARWKQLLFERSRFLAAPVLFSVLLFLAYTLYVFTPWFFDRYLYPISIVLLLVMALAIAAASSALETDGSRLRLAVISVLTILGLDGGDLLLDSNDTGARGYMEIGLWAKRNFEEGTVIGSSQTGALGYFAHNLKVINLDGVVNQACLESLEARRNMDYIRAKHIEYVLGWRVNLNFIASHSMGFRNEDLVTIRRLDELRAKGPSWYLARVRY